MKTSLPEIALTEEEVDQILRSCNRRALLVGGQALAYWATHYHVKPLGVLAENVTSHADFVGSAEVARDLWQTLRELGWKYWKPAPNDPTSQTAKLSKTVEGQGIKQVDFLGSIIGLKTENIERRASVLTLADGTQIWILHPLDVLESRLQNLAKLAVKRTSHGIAQANLALEIVRCYLEELLRDDSPRRLLDAIERVAQIAQQPGLAAVFHDYGLDLLSVVPVDRVAVEEFRSRRWPQLRAAADEQRLSYNRHREHRTAPTEKP
jgi:transposase